MARTAQFALCVTTAVSAADVPQLRGRQLASQPGNQVHDHGYTGYDHWNSGGSKDHQTEADIDQANAWWRCAEICSELGKDMCQGWTFAYNGDPNGEHRCYLKWDLTPQPGWWWDPNVISGLWEPSSELSSESPGDPLCSALSPTDPGPCPDVKGRSGANISHDPKIQCVYNPECLKEPLKGCFEETGCQYADVPQLFSVVENVATLSANLTSQYCSPQWAGNCNCDWMANNGDNGRYVDKCSCACRERNPECTDYGGSHNICYGCMFCDAQQADNYDCSWMKNCGDDGTQWTAAATACRRKYASQCGYSYTGR